MKKGGWKHNDVLQLLKHMYKKTRTETETETKISEKGDFFFWRVDSYRDWVRILQREYGIVVSVKFRLQKESPAAIELFCTWDLAS